MKESIIIIVFLRSIAAVRENKPPAFAKASAYVKTSADKTADRMAGQAEDKEKLNYD